MLSQNSTRGPLPDLAALCHVWRAGELGDAGQRSVDTGYASLNQVLPGGGWPHGALIELLQPQPGLNEWGLLAPALAALQAVAPRQLMVLVGAPYLPFGPALGARQLNMQRLLAVRAQGTALLWAVGEALQCAEVDIVLAWLPQARSANLRRLQIAAHAHDKLLFVFRPLGARQESSPAPLRLLLESLGGETGNLAVHVLKRRGPPLALPVVLATRPARLTALLAASGERVRRQREEAALALSPPLPSSAFPPLPRSLLHALDRTASLHPH